MVHEHGDDIDYGFEGDEDEEIGGLCIDEDEERMDWPGRLLLLGAALIVLVFWLSAVMALASAFAWFQGNGTPVQ